MSETQRFEKENVQTASDADLFDADDVMEDTDTESRTTTQFDTPQCTMTMVSTETSLMNVEESLNNVADQPSTWATRSDKRGTSQMDESLNNVAGQPSTWVTRSDKRGTSQMDLDQPPTRTAPLEKREKRVTNPVLPDKRRIKEVDYSETLRDIVYRQEELINNMKTEVEKQRGEHVHDINELKRQWETTLREWEEQLAKAQKEIERTRVQQQQQLEEYIKQTRETLGKANRDAIEATIQKIQEDAHDHLARERTQQEADLREKLAQREEELKRKTNEEFQERNKAILAEMEQRLQQEAEKESELAKMERRFSRRHRFQDKDIEMDNDSTMPGDAGQPSSPSAKPRSDTSCFEAIKRIKKTRGISHRVRLVDEEEIPQGHLSEQDPHLQHDGPPATTMEDAIARGVEAALRRVLIDKEFPVIKRHSPRRRKRVEKELQEEKAAEKSYERDFLLGEVRRLFKDVFNISQDIDFMLHEVASPEDVYSYEYEDGPGPNCKDIAFDLRHGSKSPWNDKVIGLLLKNCGEGVTERTGHFKAAQPKVTPKGGLETPAEVEQRLIAKKDEVLKAARQNTRRKNKYLRRAMVLEHLVKYKTDEDEEDAPGWQWLQRLVGTLGERGMSSEESDVENNIETVLRVKNMTWRRAIERELDIIDHQRIVDDDIFAPQGSKPMKRIRSAGNPMTSRAEVDGLPEALYNKEWLAGLTPRQVERLSISDERFRWMKVAVV
ncbi:hypothetical protein P692DRAFT_20871946 [Suillus brevipes Sb2]|nr:hypothetical protein P692DRAFT_20871946 [Suillus brevipes Sb2]